jgi:hypothetical protein
MNTFFKKNIFHFLTICWIFCCTLIFSQVAFSELPVTSKVSTITVEFQNQNGKIAMGLLTKDTVVQACCESGSDRGPWDPEQITLSENTDELEKLKTTLLKQLIINHCYELKLKTAVKTSLPAKIKNAGLLVATEETLNLQLPDPLPPSLDCLQTAF